MIIQWWSFRPSFMNIGHGYSQLLTFDTFQRWMIIFKHLNSSLQNKVQIRLRIKNDWLVVSYDMEAIQVDRFENGCSRFFLPKKPCRSSLWMKPHRMFPKDKYRTNYTTRYSKVLSWSSISAFLQLVSLFQRLKCRMFTDDLKRVNNKD